MKSKKKQRDFKNLSTKESRDFWGFIERTAKEVESWPCWKKSEYCGKCSWCLEQEANHVDTNGLEKARLKIAIRKAEDKELLQYIKRLEKKLVDARKEAKDKGLI